MSRRPGPANEGAVGGRATEERPLWRRLAWMAAIWAASVGALGLLSLAIRAVLHA